MSTRNERRTAVAALRTAVPYLRLFQGSTFVVKAGGDVFADPASTENVLEQIGVLHQLGIGVVLVHGGGPQLSARAREKGLEVSKIAGRRVTDAATLDVAIETLNGAVRTRILAGCRRLGIDAVGLSGIDGGIVKARRRPVRRDGDGQEQDFGFVGDVLETDVGIVKTLIERRHVPVVTPLAADDDGTVLNINADVIASRIAIELGATKLILLTGAAGILQDPADVASLVSYTDIKGLKKLEDGGSLIDGMLPKVAAIREALYGGVDRVHVISHKLRDSLLMEVFTNEGSGTLVVPDVADLMPAEVADGSRIARLLEMGKE